MRIEFDDDDLRRLYEVEDLRLPGLGRELTRAFRRKVSLIEDCATEQDLRAFKSLRLEKLAGKLGVTPAHVFAANGSNEVLQTLLLAYAGAGRSVGHCPAAIYRRDHACRDAHLRESDRE